MGKILGKREKIIGKKGKNRIMKIEMGKYYIAITNILLSLFSGQWKRTRKKGKSFKDIMKLHSSIKPETPCISFDALMIYDPIRNTCPSATVHFTLLCNKRNEFITIFWSTVILHNIPSISSACSHLT